MKQKHNFWILWTIMFTLILCNSCKKDNTSPGAPITPTTTIEGSYYRQFTEPANPPSESGVVRIFTVGSQYYVSSPFTIFDSLKFTLNSKTVYIQTHTKNNCTTQGAGSLSRDTLILNTTQTCGSTNLVSSTLYIKQ